MTWLGTVEGNLKTPDRAKAIATDVSKYLFFINPRKVAWESLLDRTKLRNYLDHLQTTSAVLVSGQIDKCLVLAKALTYIKLELTPVQDQVTLNFHRCQLLEATLVEWRRSLRKTRKLKDHLRREKAAGKQKPLTQLTAVLDHQPLRDDITQMLARAHSGPLNTSEVKTVVSTLMALMLQKNWQTPGVVTNATVHAATPVSEGGRPVGHDCLQSQNRKLQWAGQGGAGGQRQAAAQKISS